MRESGPSMGKTKHKHHTPVVLSQDNENLRLKITLPSKRLKKEEDSSSSDSEDSAPLPQPAKKKKVSTNNNHRVSMNSHSLDDRAQPESSKKPSKPKSTVQTTTANGTYWEPCLIAKQKIALPSTINQLPNLSSIFNMHVWNNVLSQGDRDKLKAYLPPLDDQATQANLEKLFAGENFHFGNPVQKLHQDLQAGECHIQVARKKEEFRHMQHKEHIHNVRVYHNKMIKRILDFRKSLGLDDTELLKKYAARNVNIDNTELPNGHSKPSPSESPASSRGSTSNSVSQSEESEVHSTKLSDTESSSSSEKETTPKIKEKEKEKVHEKEKERGKEKEKEKGKEKEKKRRTPTSDRKKQTNKTPKARKASEDDAHPKKEKPAVIEDIVKKEPTDNGVAKSESPTPPPGPPPPSLPAFMLFSMFRDYFSENNYTAGLDQLVQHVSANHVLVEHIPPLFELREFVNLGLIFLSKPPVITSQGQGGIQYEEPITSLDKATMLWRWIDQSGKNAGSQSSDEHLHSLEQLFYFATSRNLINPIDNTVDLSITQNRQQKCILTVEPSPVDVVDEYHRQEAERYRMPEKAYVYNINSVKTIVAPMKRGMGNPGNKPREHFLLKMDRPPHINLLCLVRDAASRMPGGVGTRPDVSLLLKDSQYVVEDVSDAQINSVVSGALDRLHSEKDPCVRFDSDQKLWIYLHRHRTLPDFEYYKPAKAKRGASRNSTGNNNNTNNNTNTTNNNNNNNK